MFYGFFLVYIGFFMFVVVNTLTSLFIEATMQNSARDTQIIIQEEMEKKEEYVKRIEHLYNSIDSDTSGDISWEEFHDHINTPEMGAFASSLEIDISDAREFFGLLSGGGRRRVNIENFVLGCMQLRGPARSLDLMGHIYTRREIDDENEVFKIECRRQLSAIQSAVQSIEQQCVSAL